MGQLSDVLRGGEGRVTYWCQGCEEPHSIQVGEGPGPRWGYNGDPETPTFEPSVLIRSGHYVPGWKEGDGCWCREPKPEDRWPSCAICHTFIRGGMVQFLSDCTHALAGQTLPLPPLPAYMRDDRAPGSS